MMTVPVPAQGWSDGKVGYEEKRDGGDDLSCLELEQKPSLWALYSYNIIYYNIL